MKFATEDVLLAPMHVDALPVGAPVQSGLFQWTDLAPDFSILTDSNPPLGDRLCSGGDPFEASAPLAPGIHLHFRLPEGLRHGKVVAGRAPAFPPLPNRWQVLRLVESDDGGVASWRRFLVRSDARGQTDQGARLWPVHDAADGRKVAGFAADVGGITCTLPMGAFSVLDGPLPDDDVAADPAITAIGPGDPTMPSNYRASGQLFGLHDKLPDPEIGQKPASITYLVTGWYSSVQDDPLFDVVSASLWDQGVLPRPDGVDGPQETRPEWAALTPGERHSLRADFAASRTASRPADLTGIDRERTKADIERWLDDQRLPPMTSDTADTGRLPCRLLCHGLVRRIRWGGAGVDHSRPEDAQRHEDRPVFPRHGPDKSDHRIALGEGLTEAMAAQTSPDPTLRDLLCALGEGLLDQPLTTGQLPADLHARRFENAPGETVFTAQATPAPDARPGAPTPPPPQDLRDAIAALNADQARLQKALRAHGDLRTALHELYSRAFAANAEAGSAQLDLTQDGEFASDFFGLGRDLENVASTLRDSLASRDGLLQNGDPAQSLGKLKKALAAAGPNFAVTRTTGRPFHRFADPVLTVSGTAAQRHRCAPRRAPAVCRLRAEIRSDLGVKTRIGASETNAEESILGAMFDGIPKADTLHRALLKEAILSDPDPSRVAWLSRQTGTKTGTIEAWQKQANRTDAFTFTWQGAPWIPLFAAWEAEWTPDVANADGARLPRDAITKRWRLDGKGALAMRDVAPTADQSREASGEPALGDSIDPDAHRFRFSGHAPLLLDGFESFTRKIRAILDDQDSPADGWALMKALEAGLVGQVGLSGLAEALTARQKVPALPLFDYAAWNDGKLMTLADLAGQNGPERGVGSMLVNDPSRPVLPIRDGTLTLTRLSIIDIFGQTRRLVGPDLPEDAAPPEFRCGNGLLPAPGSPRFSARMAPRLVQPARIRAALDHRDGPVAGWVVLNWLEQSLILHRADGVPVAVLQRRLGVAETGQPGFIFQPVPEALEDPDTDGFGDDDLAGFACWARTLSPHDAETFLKTLGRAVERADQRIPDHDDSAALLVGRPFALLRVDLSLELSGLPAFRSGRDAPSRSAADGLSEVDWPVQLGSDSLGNDGLAGLFDGRPSSGSTFLLTAGAAPPPPETARLGLQSLTINAETPDAAAPRRLTLLMDPQARIHVTTGVIPRSFFELPKDLAAGAKQARESYFLTAPILGFGSGGAPSLPVPSDDFGEWSWVWRPDIRNSASDPNLVHAAERGGFTGAQPTISEGWLKLSRSDLGPVSLWMREPGSLVAAGARITLDWSARGAERCVLTCAVADDDWQEISPDTTSDANGSLTGSVCFTVEKTTRFRLTAIRRQERVIRDLTIQAARIKGSTADV